MKNSNILVEKPKRRTESKEVRRRQLIDATIASIAELGMSNTTLGSVAKRAGVAHGTVNLHFPSKENLLEETLRFLAEQHYRLWLEGIKNAPNDANARLAAIVEVDFKLEIVSPQKLAVWFSFWAHANYRPLYLEICSQFDGERGGEIERLCSQINEEGGYLLAKPSTIAQRFEALIDGLWLSMLLYPETVTRQSARVDAFEYLSEVFPQHFPLQPL